MNISPVASPSFGKNTNKKYNTVKLTGYGAVVSGVASAAAGHYKKISAHKYFAGASGLLALAHIFILEKHRLIKK